MHNESDNQKEMFYVAQDNLLSYANSTLAYTNRSEIKYKFIPKTEDICEKLDFAKFEEFLKTKYEVDNISIFNDIINQLFQDYKTMMNYIKPDEIFKPSITDYGDFQLLICQLTSLDLYSY